VEKKTVGNGKERTVGGRHKPYTVAKPTISTTRNFPKKRRKEGHKEALSKKGKKKRRKRSPVRWALKKGKVSVPGAARLFSGGRQKVGPKTPVKKVYPVRKIMACSKQLKRPQLPIR